MEGENASIVSARPSDAIALAVRTGSPIFVAESVLDEAGYSRSAEPEAEDPSSPPDEVIAQFKDFLESVNPDDFKS